MRNSRSRRVLSYALLTALATGAAVKAGTTAFRERPLTSPDAADSIDPRTVHVERVTSAPTTAPMTFSGVVRSARRAKLSFTLSGRLAARSAQIGDSVPARAALARLDTSPFHNALRLAKARLAQIDVRLQQTTRDVDRQRRLVERGAGLSEQLEKQTSALAALRASKSQARADVAEARRRLKEATLLAPFEGTVIEANLEPGEFVRAGEPVLILGGEDQLEVEVRVPEAIRSRLAVGAAVPVKLPLAGGDVLSGRVARLGRGASGAGALFPVVVHIPRTKGLAPGYTAEVAFDIKTAETTSSPSPPSPIPVAGRPMYFESPTTPSKRCPSSWCDWSATASPFDHP